MSGCASMTPFQFRDMTLMADEEGAGAFKVFDPAYPQATDTGPSGMVAEMDTFLRLTVGMKHFVDVGALFGIFSLVFTRNPGTIAYAIEASPWAFPFLENHCVNNPSHNIEMFNRFAGDLHGRTVNCTRDWKHVAANLNRGGDAEHVTMYEERLDDMPEIVGCDVMKIDVEAYECHVLRGAAGLIGRFRPLLFVECHMENLPDNGDSRASLMDCFSDLDYRVERFDGTAMTDFDQDSMTRVIACPN